MYVTGAGATDRIKIPTPGLSLLLKKRPLSPETWGFPGGSAGEESTCNTGDTGPIPGLGRSSGGGKGHPLQCSCLENPRDGGDWWAAIYGVAQSQTQLKQLSSSSSSNLHSHCVIVSL